jgi:8-oxo-dGDP phosphatase
VGEPMTGRGVDRNPWKTVTSHMKYGNAWFSVREDEVIRPDGSAGIYGVVSAERLAVGILPLWPDNSLTLVGQYRYAIEEYSWEIPEGGGNASCDALDIAVRELREETGLVADRWTYLGRVHTSNCFVQETCHLYLAECLTQRAAEPGPDELLEVARVPLEEAVAMAGDGRITDGISIAGIFRLSLYLEPSFGDRSQCMDQMTSQRHTCYHCIPHDSEGPFKNLESLETTFAEAGGELFFTSGYSAREIAQKHAAQTGGRVYVNNVSRNIKRRDLTVPVAYAVAKSPVYTLRGPDERHHDKVYRAYWPPL